MKQSPPSWTMSSRISATSKEQTPGPGAYTPTDYTTNTSHKSSFGSWNKKSLKIPENLPSPQSYTPNFSKILPNSGSFRFVRKSQPNSSSIEDSPGPGNYSPKSPFSGPKFSISHKQQRNSSQISPGPGQYNSLTEKPKQFRLGKSKRTPLSTTEDTPGPGFYPIQTSLKESPKFGFGSGKRRSLSTNTNPGPGDYNLRLEFSGGVSLGARRAELSNKLAVPGPGSYNCSPLDTSHKFSMGISDRHKFPHSESPGPDTVRTRDETSKKFNEEDLFSFGAAKREIFPDKSKLPGPGLYNNEKIVTEKTVKIFKNEYEPKRPIVPGPGAYTPENNKETAPGWGFGKIGKKYEGGFNKQKQEQPAPGLYSQERPPEGPKWGFGSGARPNQAKKGVPGPGEYNR